MCLLLGDVLSNVITLVTQPFQTPCLSETHVGMSRWKVCKEGDHPPKVVLIPTETTSEHYRLHVSSYLLKPFYSVAS